MAFSVAFPPILKARNDHYSSDIALMKIDTSHIEKSLIFTLSLQNDHLLQLSNELFFEQYFHGSFPVPV